MLKRGRKLTKQSPQKQIQKQVTSLADDDYCFVCKDGGLLIVCDHKECGKSYHPDCVGKEESTGEEEEDENQWICAWHNCLVCQKSSKYQCFCCPNAVCQSCFKDAVFAKTRGNKGFCSNCLKLAMLGEEGLEYDSDGEKVDFKDRETYEGLFKEYWDIIKENEGLTLEDLHHADVQIKKGENAKKYLSYKKGEFVKHQPKKADSDLDEYKKEEEKKESSDDHVIDVDGISSGEDEVVVQPVIVKTKKRPRTSKAKEKPKFSKRIEFMGWASKPLIEFLGSIGVDTIQKLPQSAVASLIHKYAQDNKLFNPDKKKVILCDLRLQSAFGRKSFSVYKINDVIEPHLAENIDQSDDEGYSSGYEENNNSVSTKKEAWWRKPGSFQNKGPLLEKFQQKEAILEEPVEKEPPVRIEYSRFATIILKNLKLVYLRKSLVEQFLGQYDTFESKVVGSFVKVKCDLDSKCSYQLLPVTGITESSDDSDMQKVLLQISNLANDVSINMLSNDDLSEDDCEHLRKNVENGLLENPAVVELEKKAKILHEDITKHWIARELSILRYRIDLANEKGRRAELFEYRRRRDLLQSEEEQSRLLNEAPHVIADVIEMKTNAEEPPLGDTPEKAVSTFNPDMTSVEEGKITA